MKSRNLTIGQKMFATAITIAFILAGIAAIFAFGEVRSANR